MIILLLIIIFILYNKIKLNFNKERHKSIKQILKNINKNSDNKIKSIWQSIPNNGFNKDETWKIHSLYVNNTKELPYLLLIHGANSSSLEWVNILIKLSYKFRIFAIDLPGFGYSPTPKCLKNANAKQSIKLIINMLKQWIKINKIKKISLLGHSFGAFISINFSHKYPELVDRIILASPVGILPTLDYNCFYWAIIFKLYPIQIILRLIFPYISLILYKIIDIKYYYEFLLFSEPTVIGHFIIAKHITINWHLGECYWNTPIFRKLLQLKNPISFIYGDLDTITPIHQGKLLKILLGNNISCLQLDNIGHFIKNSHINILSNTIEQAYNKASIINSNNKITKNKLLLYKSSFNIYKTKIVIKNLYRLLINLQNENDSS